MEQEVYGEELRLRCTGTLRLLLSLCVRLEGRC